MGASTDVSTVHAVVVLLAGFAWAFAAREDRVAAWGGYVAASDVLWRMTGASIPWESAKYAFVGVLLFAALRSGRRGGSGLPLLYVGLLIPSTLLAVWTLGGPQQAFNGISFNLSGPLALGIGAWFFSRMVLSGAGYAATLIAAIAPVVSIASVALVRTFLASSGPVVFSHSSNFASSGGFGPNQVSAILGLGALLSLLLFLVLPGAGWFRIVLFALLIGFACQSALTFSRGGIYTAAGAAAAGVPFLIGNRGARRRLAVGGAVAVVLALLLLLPGLEAFTGGALGDRFADVGMTGRDRIAGADMEIWKENPILGIGLGLGPAGRMALLGAAPAAHTEWTRLLAEHGVLGFGAALCLLAMAWRSLAADRGRLERALSAALIAWAFLFMLHAGMRLAAPAFAMSMAQCRLRGSAAPRGSGAS